MSVHLRVMTEKERWGAVHVYHFRVTDTGVENLLNPSTLTNTHCLSAEFH